MLSWYKTLSESFHMIKDMQSPPLSRIQPDFFVKSSLIWYGFLFSYAWKSLSISFCAIAFCRQFYFLFCVKDSLNRKKFVYYPQPTTCLSSHRVIWFANIFSRRENFSLFVVLFFVFAILLSLYRYLLFLSLLFRFLFYRENRSLSTLNSQTFSFCVKIPLFSLSDFSIKRIF